MKQLFPLLRGKVRVHFGAVSPNFSFVTPVGLRKSEYIGRFGDRVDMSDDCYSCEMLRTMS